MPIGGKSPVAGDAFVQWPMAACSGGQSGSLATGAAMDDAVGGGTADCAAGDAVGGTQCPIAACSGGHGGSGGGAAGADAGLGASAGRVGISAAGVGLAADLGLAAFGLAACGSAVVGILQWPIAACSGAHWVADARRMAVRARLISYLPRADGPTRPASCPRACGRACGSGTPSRRPHRWSRRMSLSRRAGPESCACAGHIRHGP